jgi:uncharacterized protein
VLDGRLLIDVHLHAARIPTLKPAWQQWAHDFGGAGAISRVYNEEGSILPGEFDVNPHLHHSVADEFERQIGLGAIGLKVHPVHGGFPVNDRALYSAYEICQSADLPVIVRCGTSTFPGSMNQFADPILLDDVLRDFPHLDFVLAHGGRGWWYDAAAFLALSNEHVWLELSGLPPSRLREYYARHDWPSLTQRMIFGTDSPGVPGIADNARAVAALCPDDATADLVLSAMRPTSTTSSAHR